MAEDMSAYADEAPVPEANILELICVTAQQYRAAEASVLTAELALKVEQEKLRVLREETLPELMAKARQLECTTEDGYVVAVENDLRGSLPKGQNAETAARRARGLAFILDLEPSILKSQLLADLGKPRKMANPVAQAEEDERHAKMVESARASLAGLGIAARQSLDVHPMTLKAFARELLDKGLEVPLEDLGLSIQKKATVTQK